MMLFSDKKPYDLTYNRQMTDLLSLLSSGIEAVNPYTCVTQALRMADQTNLELSCMEPSARRTFQLDRYDNIYVIGCGKAAAPMAAAVEYLCGDFITEGHITVKYDYTGKIGLQRCSLFEAGHPEPDKNSVMAGSHIYSLLDSASENDLIIALLSGGGSSLWFIPEEKISLEDAILLNKTLIACGAAIGEINTVRKQVSKLAGGKAACIAYPAQVLVLSISDVIGDHPGVIASGPFSINETNPEDAIQVIEKYNIIDKIPDSVLKQLNYLKVHDSEVDLKSINSNVTYCICGNNEKALKKIVKSAKEKKYEVTLLNRATYGEARVSARDFIQQVQSLVSEKKTGKMCIVAGGETTVTLNDKHGTGGRNLEFALAAAIELKDTIFNDNSYRVSILSCGTDGTDGPTDAAGAIINTSFLKSINKDWISDAQKALDEHNSYDFFSRFGGIVQTGPTNTNVMDIQIAVIENVM